MSELKIGWAEESLTPDQKINLAGQFYDRVSEYVETPLTATAMAVESDGDQMVIVSTDLLEVQATLLRKIRALLLQNGAEEAGLDTKKVLVGAIHTHTSFVYATDDAGSGSTLSVLKSLLGDSEEDETKTENADVMSPEDAELFIANRVAKVALAAWKARRKAYYTNQFGRVAVGMCRRVVYDDGSALMWGDTNSANFRALESGNDSGMELLYVYDESKQLTGVVANIACPAQVLEHRSFVSSDYWGKTKRRLREKLGKDLFLLPLCSAAGDMCPRDLIRWVNPETPINDPNIVRGDNTPLRKADPSMFDIKGCELIAKRVSNEICSVYEEISPDELKDSACLCHQVVTMDLPLRRVTIAEYKNALEIIEKFAQANADGTLDFHSNAMMHVYAGTILRYRYQQTHDIFPIESHLIRFGDVAIATNPFELFLDYGNQIRARSLAQQTFLIQLCCGSCGYLPTARAEEGSHYSAYVSSGNVGHVGGEQLVRKTVDTLNAMWRTDSGN